jgi:hypothetical protein
MPQVAVSAAQKSTNGRSPVPSPVQWLLGALARTSPALASRVVERLFFYPPRSRPSARALESLAPGARRAVTHDGLEVAYWVWEESGPAVYLLHGWAGAAAQLTSFVPELTRLGFTVVAIDAPAHGASGGRRSSMLHFSRALRAVVEREGAPHAVIAHSLGGAAAAHAVHEGMPADRLVFIGTPADIGTYFRGFLGAVGIPRRLHDAVVDALQRRFGFRWEHLGLPRLGPSMRTPLLVLHDTGDEEIPFADGELVARTWPGAVLVPTSGLGHRRILRDAEVVTRAVRFVSDAARERSTA